MATVITSKAIDRAASLGLRSGALENRVERQNEHDVSCNLMYETCFLIADYHSLTTSLET